MAASTRVFLLLGALAATLGCSPEPPQGPPGRGGDWTSEGWARLDALDLWLPVPPGWSLQEDGTRVVTTGCMGATVSAQTVGETRSLDDALLLLRDDLASRSRVDGFEHHPTLEGGGGIRTWASLRIGTRRLQRDSLLLPYPNQAGIFEIAELAPAQQAECAEAAFESLIRSLPFTSPVGT